MSYIGVLHPSMIDAKVIKKHSLYFDEFHIPGLKMFKLYLRESQKVGDKETLDTINFLERVKAIQGIDLTVDELDWVISQANLLSTQQSMEFDSYVLAKFNSPFMGVGNIDVSKIRASDCMYSDLPGSTYKGQVSPLLHPILSGGFESLESDILARAYSTRLNKNGIPATPIIKKIEYDENKNTDRNVIISLVIRQFPELSNDVAFDEIFSFKSENRHTRNVLKYWINALAKGDFTAREAEDTIEYFLSTYEVELEKRKFHIGFDVFETLVKVPLEIAEYLLSLNFSAALKSILSIRKHNAKLLQSELELEGHEIAYIHNANQQFSKKL